MSRVVTEENEQIARRAAAAFGGAVKVVEYWDEPERSMIPIVTAEGSHRSCRWTVCRLTWWGKSRWTQRERSALVDAAAVTIFVIAILIVAAIAWKVWGRRG